MSDLSVCSFWYFIHVWIVWVVTFTFFLIKIILSVASKKTHVPPHKRKEKTAKQCSFQASGNHSFFLSVFYWSYFPPQKVSFEARCVGDLQNWGQSTKIRFDKNFKSRQINEILTGFKVMRADSRNWKIGVITYGGGY